MFGQGPLSRNRWRARSIQTLGLPLLCDCFSLLGIAVHKVLNGAPMDLVDLRHFLVSLLVPNTAPVSEFANFRNRRFLLLRT